MRSIMNIIHNGRKYKIYSSVKIPKPPLKGIHKGYIYFIRIGKIENRKFKIGTANNVLRRLLEHCNYYKEEIFLLWVSPICSKYTTFRVEDYQKDLWKLNIDWIYIENDRFLIPFDVYQITIKIKKEYVILLE